MKQDRETFELIAEKLRLVEAQNWKPDARICQKVRQYRTQIKEFEVRIGLPNMVNHGYEGCHTDGTPMKYFLSVSEVGDIVFSFSGTEYDEEIEKLFLEVDKKSTEWRRGSEERFLKALEDFA